MTTTTAIAGPTEEQTLLVVRINRGINLLAGRDDLIAKVKWDATADEPPAWFVPAHNEVTLNGPVALDGADPAAINPLTPAGRRRNPVLVGLLCHEAGHAHSTRWDAGFGDDIPAVVARAVVLLEDIRIEHRQLQRRPGDRLYLRAASQRLILPAAATSTAAANRWTAAQAAALTAGRGDAGVLDKQEYRNVVVLCRSALGGKDFDRLRRVWRKALALHDGDMQGLLRLARRWVDIVGVENPADAPAPPCAHGVLGQASADESADEPGATGAAPADTGSGEPDAGEPEGGENSAATELAKTLAGAFRDVMDVVGARGAAQAAAELEEDSPTREPHEVRGERQAQEAADRETAAEHAQQVFHGHSPVGAADPRGICRPPTDEERSLARQIGAALRRARYRERGRIVTTSAVPPGRLMGREAMLGAAQRARSAPVTAKPFRHVVRRDTPEPELTVGIGVDISGSMTWATDVMASLAWMVAHAVDHVGGRSAMVAFGETVTAITKPGVVPRHVQTFIADDGCEMFTDAMWALDGGLFLTSGDGVRIVFVASDGRFGAPGERKRADAMVDRLVRHGVLVIWLDLQHHGRGSHTIVPPGAVRLPVTKIQNIPRQVSTALVKALRNR